MKVSLNTVKQFIDSDVLPVDELVQRMGLQLGGVIDLAAKYKDALISEGTSNWTEIQAKTWSVQ